MAVPDIKSDFKKRRTRQLLLLIPLVPIIFLMVFISKSNPSDIAGISAETITYAGLGIVICAVIFSLVNWRCPACGKYIGKSLSPKFCEGCGAELQ